MTLPDGMPDDERWQSCLCINRLEVINLDILFENQYKRTKEFHKEVYSFSFFKQPLNMFIYIIVALVLTGCFLSVILPRVFPVDNSVWLYISVLVIVVAIRFVRYFRAVEISRKRDLEVNNGELVEMRIILTKEGIESCCVNSESKNHISYQSIRKIILIRHYYVLLTEAKHYIVLKKDGFVKGTPDEFLSFINSRLQNVKVKGKMRIVFICIASTVVLLIAALLYIANGRTVFEKRSKPTQTEQAKIREIIAFEQAKLSECVELLSSHDDRIKELGIEILPVLEQTRSVNNQGLVEKHDWNKDNWVPKFYSSKIICYVCKDGEWLESRTSNNSTSYFADIFWLLYAERNENATYNETPFDHFDTRVDSLLDQVARFLSSDTIPSEK